MDFAYPIPPLWSLPRPGDYTLYKIKMTCLLIQKTMWTVAFKPNSKKSFVKNSLLFWQLYFYESWQMTSETRKKDVFPTKLKSYF